jgi:hypothetical protein
LPQVDLRAALRRQLGFIRRSCESFDSGFHDEGIRIAQCVRILIHDTNRQTSVLTQLQAKVIKLISTCLDIESKTNDPNSLAFGARMLNFNGMGRYHFGPEGISYFPKLGDGMWRYELPVAKWWTQTVFVLDATTTVSRMGVVLSAADKDGGAHVDPKLTPEYERLVIGGDLGCFTHEDGTQIPVSGHHYVALRQVGYEVLSSPELLALADEPGC